MLHKNSIMDMALLRSVLMKLTEKYHNNDQGVFFGLLLTMVDNIIEREGAMAEVEALNSTPALTEDEMVKLKEMFREIDSGDKNMSLAMVYAVYRKLQEARE